MATAKCFNKLLHLIKVNESVDDDIRDIVGIFIISCC